MPRLAINPTRSYYLQELDTHATADKCTHRTYMTSDRVTGESTTTLNQDDTRCLTIIRIVIHPVQCETYALEKGPLRREDHIWHTSYQT
jgi:hypothetical protein